MRRHLARLSAYRDHADRRAACANTLALVLAWNGPFYPLYLTWIAGRAAWPAWLALWSVPCFAAVPALCRRSVTGGVAGLMVVATLNTVVYMALIGTQAGLQLFLLPCAALATIMPWRARWLGGGLAGLVVLLFLVLPSWMGAPLGHFSARQYSAMRLLSDYTVAVLTLFMALLFSRMAEPG